MKTHRLLLALASITAISLAAWWWIPDLTIARATIIAAAFLVLCLSEVVPPFVPMIVLLVMTPLLLGPLEADLQLSAVLTWPAIADHRAVRGGHGTRGCCAAARCRRLDRRLPAIR